MQKGKPVILCIDDDEDVLATLRIVLERNNYVCVEASTAEEGLAKFRERAPDFTIVDLMMEEVDAGTSFVKEIRAAGSQIPIYLLSSIGDQLNLSADYVALGLSGVFQKPVNPDVLLKTIKTRLG